DAADLGSQVEDELWRGILEEPGCVGLACQVVVPTAGDERLDALTAQPLDEMRAEEAAAAGDEDTHAAKRRRPGRYGKAPWSSGRHSSRSSRARTARTSRRSCSKRATRCTG